MNMQSLLQVDFFLQVITTGRTWSIVAGMVGLISVIIGRLAMSRAARGISSARLMGIVALVVALTGIVLSVVHLARTSGGFGTGSGKLGAIVAMVVGLIGIVFGGLAMVRLRRIVGKN